MSKPAQQIIDSIVKEFAECRQKSEELKAKSLFRLLNYCPSSWEAPPEKLSKSE
jgi:hypothetical protein